jgi:peptidoglycan/LPS O-acetylase OafA/YrhL
LWTKNSPHYFCTLLRKASSQNPATVLLLDSVVLFCGIPNRSTKRITLLLRVEGLRLVSASFIELVDRKRPHVIVADQSFLVTGDRRTVLFRVAFTGFCPDRRSLAKATVAIAVCSFLCRAVAAAVHPETTGFIYFYTPFRIEPMAIGSLPAIVADDELLWTKLVSYRLMLFWAGFALWITTIFLGNNRVTCVFGISGIGAVALAMLIEAANGRSAFDIPFFRNLGKYSYALYVIHYPIYLLTSGFFRSYGRFWDFVLTAIVGIPLTYLLARVSWALIESPFLRLKHDFKYKAGPRRVLTPAGLTASSNAAK